MPTRMWKHICTRSNGLTWLGVATCTRCGRTGEYDGWHYTMHEAMARYQQRYGLKPIGPHRCLADQLFDGTATACEQCGGRGLLDINRGQAYSSCPTCNGMGYVFIKNPEEIEAIREQVLKVFPDARVQGRTVDPASANLALNLETSTMEDLSNLTSSKEIPPQDFSGRSFSTVFQQPQSLAPSKWRIRNSGVHGLPEESEETRAVVTVYEALGINVKRYWMGSPVNVDSHHLEARFLDGGLDASTGKYFYSERGAWIEGPKAVLLIALKLGLRVRNVWRQRFNLEGTTLGSLELELKRGAERT